MWQTVIAKTVQLKYSANQGVFKYSIMNLTVLDQMLSRTWIKLLNVPYFQVLIFPNKINETLTKIKQQVLCFSHDWNNFEGQLLLKPYPEHSPMQNQLCVWEG